MARAGGFGSLTETMAQAQPSLVASRRLYFISRIDVPLAEPGALCWSRQVYDGRTRNEPAWESRDLGRSRARKAETGPADVASANAAALNMRPTNAG
jgi:hypothetical protein